MKGTENLQEKIEKRFKMARIERNEALSTSKIRDKKIRLT